MNRIVIFASRCVVTWGTGRGRLKRWRDGGKGARFSTRTLTSRGSGAWKEEMNMKLIVFRQVQPGAQLHAFICARRESFCLSVYRLFSPPLHASPLPLAILPIFLAPSPRRFFSLSLSSLPCLRRIFERLFTRLVARFHGVVSRAPATTMDKRAEKGRPRRGPRVKILFFLIAVSSWKLPLSPPPLPLDIIVSSYLIRYAF